MKFFLRPLRFIDDATRGSGSLGSQVNPPETWTAGPEIIAITRIPGPAQYS